MPVLTVESTLEFHYFFLLYVKVINILAWLNFIFYNQRASVKSMNHQYQLEWVRNRKNSRDLRLLINYLKVSGAMLQHYRIFTCKGNFQLFFVEVLYAIDLPLNPCRKLRPLPPWVNFLLQYSFLI